MSDQYEDTKPTWINKALGIGAAAVAFVLMKALVGGGIGFLSAQSTSAADVEEAVTKSPDVAPLFYQLKESYPEQYNQFLNEMAANVRNGANVQEARRQGAQFTRAFIVSKTTEISQAPVSDLRNLAQAQLAFSEQLERDGLRLCASYSMVGLSPDTVLRPATTRLMADVGKATILAASAGERNPSGRPMGDLADADAAAWVEAMLLEGGSERLLTASSNPNTMTLQDQCDFGKLAYRATLALPDEQMARLMGFLTRQSAATPMPR